jgi:hypothetical protein
MARHLATIGRLTVWLDRHIDGAHESALIRFVVDDSRRDALNLSLDQSVELARLLVKTAAQHGWGSDEEKQRIIAWAQVKK